MTKHSGPALFIFVLLLGLCSIVGLAELALQFPTHHFLMITAVGMAMIVSAWIWSLLPPKVSAREWHRMALIIELQNLQYSLDMAIENNDLISENAVRQEIAQVKADSDFAYQSWD